jgi:hypothetical protein
MVESVGLWMSVLLGSAIVAAFIAGLRRARLTRLIDPWPVAIMGDLREFDTIRICQLIGSPESHLAMSDATRPPVVGDQGVVLDWVQKPSSDPLARIIVESEQWLAVFRRDELELVSRASKSPLSG